MAAACPAVDDVQSSLPPPKKPQHMTWAMSLASAYARIFSALESGRDVLAMPPVGSLRLDCYRQLVKQLIGITLIISSYKERMEKEIDILEKDGIPAAMLHSGLSDYAMAAQLERIRRRHFQVLFASPGLLEDPKMRSFLVFKTTISLIVIDEAQICSIHAPHFQPLYHSIPLLLKDLERHAAVRQASGEPTMPYRGAASGTSIEGSPETDSFSAVHIEASERRKFTASSRPPVLALTLPTTRQMEQDIGHFFSLQHPLLVRHAFECPNLFLSVHRPQRKAPFLLDFLRRHEDEAGIIYCTEHRLTEHIAQLLNRSGFPALSYHAGLTREERMANARAFCAGAASSDQQTSGSRHPNARMTDAHAFCAGTATAARQTSGSRHPNARMTNARAFCAGAPSSDRRIQRPSTHDAEAHAGARILVVTPDPFLELDRSDVRFVLHYTMPESLERYYQELVHAGRDGLPAECILLANERDFELQRTKLEKVTLGYPAYPEAVAQVKRQLEAMRRYAMTHQCLRSFLRDYFGGEDPVDYEVITLPSRNRVLTSAELPVDESLRTIRQSGHYPKNRVQKVSMQLKRAEKQHIFIRYADQAYMKNQAYKYEHLRTDPWELCEPGIRVQRFRAFSIPRDSCCVNCDPEHFLEEDRYGISDTMGLQERMREHRHQLETDMDVGRKIRLWKAGEKPYHFDYDAHTKCTGRIMAMRKVEYQKTAATMAAVLGQSSKSSIETPAHASTAPGASSSVPESPADDRLPATTPCEGNASVRTSDGKAGRGGYARGSDDEAGSVGYARTDDAEAGRGGYARTSDGEAEAQQLRLLENARLEISPEMRTHLLGNLKALRKRLAMERSVQAYLIFTDKSLVEMCRMLPLTREEFARIYGVGQRKLELHYEAFTDEIRKALDPAYVADFYENVSEEMQVDMQDGTGACVTGERTGMNDSADPVRVAEFYANASEEVQCTAGERTGMNDSVDAARVKRAPGTYAPSSNPVIPTSVIKPIPQERSESQRNPKYRFIPDDVLLAFLEEKYLQQRTRKQVKKKQDFFLTVAEAASFRCADGLRSPEIAALLNALVAEAEEISSTNSPIASIDVGVSDNGSTSAAVATENPGETQTSNAVAMENPGEIQISDAVAAKNPGELTNQPKLRVRERKKLSGATINRKLAELGYLKLSEYRFNGRPHQTFLPTTKGEAAGIVLGTRKSQGGVDYPTAYFSAAAASWVATLFVRDETK
ncbi:HRDC domain-containing protein [Oribacterium sp. P9]|uniref:RecQ family ATP-dependent DNA helicase n=1 Tax=Oribacterium sp. P9 TaxID=3378068 RepID=UPI0039679D28